MELLLNFRICPCLANGGLQGKSRVASFEKNNSNQKFHYNEQIRYFEITGDVTYRVIRNLGSSETPGFSFLIFQKKIVRLHAHYFIYPGTLGKWKVVRGE